MMPPPMTTHSTDSVTQKPPHPPAARGPPSPRRGEGWGEGALRPLHALENLQPAHAIDQEDQAAIIHEDVVALAALGARCGIGQVVPHLARRMRMRDVDDPQALREPREGHFGALDLL